MTPTAFKSPCAAGGCGEATREKYCETHTDEEQERKRKAWQQADEERPSPAERGYDRRWRKVSEMYRDKHPVCERCEELYSNTSAAALTHHIRPIEKGGNRLDTDNLWALCKRCHGDVHSSRVQGYAKAYVICGPPGVGKTTYVQDRLRWGDLVVDVDYLWRALTGLEMRAKPEPVYPLVMDVRDFLLDKLRHPTSVDRAWVVATAPRAEKRQQLASETNGEIVLLLSDREEIKRRIREDETRSDVDQQLELVEEWFDAYTERDDDQVVRV